MKMAYVASERNLYPAVHVSRDEAYFIGMGVSLVFVSWLFDIGSCAVGMAVYGGVECE